MKCDNIAKYFLIKDKCKSFQIPAVGTYIKIKNILIILLG